VIANISKEVINKCIGNIELKFLVINRNEARNELQAIMVLYLFFFILKIMFLPGRVKNNKSLSVIR
jgi:hypothetical protein